MDGQIEDVTKAGGDSAFLEKADNDNFTPTNSESLVAEVIISDSEDTCENVPEDEEPAVKKVKIDESTSTTQYTTHAPDQDQDDDIIILESHGIKHTQDDMAMINTKDKPSGPVKRRSNILINAEVKEIVAIQRLRTGGRNLLVRWKHLSDEYDTWMGEDKLSNDPVYKLFVQQEKEIKEKRRKKVKQTLRNKH